MSRPSSKPPTPRPTLDDAFDVPTLNRSSKHSRSNNASSSRRPRSRSFEQRSVPYPLSYDKELLHLYSLDRQLMYSVKGACSFVDFSGDLPKRSLDLGTGLGDWCIDAAKEWPDCTFVGFDIAHSQIDLKYVEPSIASRIEWKHGDFLEPLPFEDDTFDFVHMFGTAFCVPEDKWHSLFDEIHRVLKPGGHVEVVEEDAIFPVLPRWFTDPLHRNSVNRYSSSSGSSLYSTTSDELTHDYELLELLFNAAFESRFVNPTPCSILPGYFSATFSHVISPPILLFPMPPLAPLPPLPSIASATMPHAPLKFSEDTHFTSYSLPPITATIPLETQLLSPETSLPPSRRSSMFRPSNDDAFESERFDSARPSGEGRPSLSSHYEIPRRQLGVVAMPTFAKSSESTEVGGEEAWSLLGMEKVAMLDEHAAYTHLGRMFGIVYSAKDSMLEELLNMVSQGDPALERFGWDFDDYTEETTREKYDTLWEQYHADMHARISLWYPMTQYGWHNPRRTPMSRAELLDEERLRHAILEARNHALEGEIQPTMRAMRLLVGVKDATLPIPNTV